MPAYMISQVTVKDKEKFQSYIAGTLKWPTFAPPHGRFLLRR